MCQRIRSLVLLLIFMTALPVFSEIPQVINYQGKVTDTGGIPVADGIYNVAFVIFDAATGGTELWNSGVQSIAVSEGIFNVLLGEIPMLSLDLPFDEDYWLEVDIEGDIQSPRERLGSMGYSYMASGLVPGTEVNGSVTSGTLSAIKAVNTATTGPAYGGYFQSSSITGLGIFGSALSTSGTNYGGRFESYSPDGRAVFGYATATTGQNYGGRFQSNSTSGTGIYGSAAATTGYNYGVYGQSSSTSGYGVYGETSATTGTNYGVYGRNYSTSGYGVFGHATASTGTNYGVYGRSDSPSGHGVRGYAPTTTGSTYGIYGKSDSTSGYGVYGEASATTGETHGVFGRNYSTNGYAVSGFATASTGTNYGVFGMSYSTSGYAVSGFATAYTGTNYGVCGTTWSTDGFGGLFGGDVLVTGNFSKGSGSFLIDHPLDPENMLLRHNFMESPENLVVYRGKAQLDKNGEAVVEMPEYFGALTKEDDATVNLTPIGKPYLFGYEMKNENEGFTIFGEPNREIAWTVYADRDDPVIHELARPVEEAKGPDNKYCDQGKLLYPKAYGYPENMGRDYEQHERERVRMEEERARMDEERNKMEEEPALLKADG